MPSFGPEAHAPHEQPVKRDHRPGQRLWFLRPTWILATATGGICPCCSGKFEKDMAVQHARTGKTIRYPGLKCLVRIVKWWKTPTAM